MKRTVVISFIVIFAAVCMLVGCSGQAADSDKTSQLQVYTSFYPLYDFTQKIGGDLVEVYHLLPPGADPHDFEPTSKQMVALTDADLFIYNGAGFEAWAEKAVDMLDTEKTRVIQTTEQLDLLTNEAHGHEHGDHDDDGHHDEASSHDHGTFDPHVWLDPMLAKQQAEAITAALIDLDPDNEHVYKANFKQLAAQFDALDQALQDVTEHTERNEIVVSHAAFGYLTRRYGLEQIPIAGLSTSDEPSQKEMKSLIDFVKQHKVPYIMFEPLVSTKVANVVKNGAGVEALTLNSLENLTKEELERGEDYFTIMEQNKQNLAKALGSRVNNQ